MTGWDREYLANKEEYLKIFDGAMQQEQEQNVEFLEKSLTKITGRKYAVACNSGTDALHFALISLDIKPYDEILTTEFSWISTASCISMVGATPVFCEPNILNYHMDLDSIKKMYSPKVKAIIYPHLFGNMSDTKEILDFCKEKNIAFIEDAAQSLGASLNDVKAGSIGDVSCLSFNANKVVAGIAGGGAILTDDKDKAELFRKLRRHGNNEVLGRNSKMLMLNACFINFRLKKMNEWISKRQEIAKQYDEQLKDYVTIQPTTNGLNHNYHKYVIRLQNKKVRDMVKDKLGAKVHYDKPLSENTMYKKIAHRKDKTFISKIICDTILTLPIHPYMKQEEIDEVINTILILLGHEENKFVKNMKRVLGDDLFDKSLVNETTEPIYDYIVEKTYQTPGYIEEVEFKNKRKLKISFNKFYENITRDTR
jgi:UDP-2-acetamido-2-deoxy-ribo-hexuluronate aminotransferase|tara:strand:+ start:15249 stop:16523 length:1275 start_codon:yes stop_codon:yes gene_type:complete